MEERRRGDIFQGLKQALKARNMTYADLAERLGLSEPTIKRIFAECDCKMARLLTICDMLNISLADLVERAGRARDEPVELAPQVERELAENRSLFYLFILLRDGVSESEIMARYRLSKTDLFLVMTRLEKLGLAKADPDGRIRVSVEPPIRFRRHGPLHPLITDINTRFLVDIAERQDGAGAAFHTISRRMLPDSADTIRRELTALDERIKIIARQDQLLAHEHDLETYKLSAAFGPIHFPDLVKPSEIREAIAPRSLDQPPGPSAQDPLAKPRRGR